MVALGEHHRQHARGRGEALRRQPERLVLVHLLARVVVGGDEVDGAVEDRFPQRLAVVLGAERRIGLAHAAELGVLGVREVVRAGLDDHVLEALAPEADHVERLARGDVRKVHARAELLGQVHGAQRRLGLGDRGLGGRPVLERAAARGLDLPALAVDDLDVLGMADDDRPPDARRFLEQVVEEAVVGAVQPEVASFLALEVHEVLERGDAVVAHVLAELLDVELVGGAEVEAEVHVRARDGVLELAPEHVAVRLVVEEVAEHRGEAALRGVGGLGRVLGDLLAHAEVHMAVDEAGEHVQARCRLLGDARRRIGN